MCANDTPLEKTHGLPDRFHSFFRVFVALHPQLNPVHLIMCKWTVHNPMAIVQNFSWFKKHFYKYLRGIIDYSPGCEVCYYFQGFRLQDVSLLFFHWVQQWKWEGVFFFQSALPISLPRSCLQVIEAIYTLHTNQLTMTLRLLERELGEKVPDFLSLSAVCEKDHNTRA